jgi:hypothetical protein
MMLKNNIATTTITMMAIIIILCNASLHFFRVTP